MAGHSFGGMTSLLVAAEDQRIKAVFTMDPWIWCRVPEIQSGKFKLTQPNFNIMSEGFTPICEQYFNYDNDKELKAMMNNSSCTKN